MAKKNNKTELDKVLHTKVNRMWEAAQNARKEVDWKWFMYDLWINGNHYAKWDRNTQQISSPREDGRPKVVINKVYATLRAVRNYALRNRPRAEVTPVNLTEETVAEVVKLNKYLDFLHDKLKLRDKMKDSVWHALGKSVGWWQILWAENDEGGEIEVHVVDPYDLYIDPLARDPEEARFMFLAVRRNLEDLRNDSKYSAYKEVLEKMSGDKLVAASNMKARLMNHERGEVYSSDKENGSVIVKECWLKEFKDGKSLIKIVTIAGDQCIRNEETDLERFPFFRLRADAEPLSMYGQGWVKNIIPLNRLLNRLESSLAEYNELMNKGKYVVDKNAEVRVINNEHGQIIEKKASANLESLNIPTLSAAIYTQIENVNRYIEDIGALHDATMGRIPTGAKSGRALEALQAGDSNNMSEIVENIEVFLEEVYEYMLKLAAQKYQFARNITPVSQTGEREFIKVIGEGAQVQPEGATVIPLKNMVDVKITSWLANTTEVRQEILKELYQLQVIDQQTLLEGYEIGAVADIIQRTRIQRQEQQAEELAMKGEEQKMGQPPAAGQQEAIAAIRSILNGTPPVVPPNPSPEFVDYVDDFIDRGQEEGDDPQELQLLQTFRDQVVQGAGRMQQEQPQPAAA